MIIKIPAYASLTRIAPRSLYSCLFSFFNFSLLPNWDDRSHVGQLAVNLGNAYE